MCFFPGRRGQQKIVSYSEWGVIVPTTRLVRVGNPLAGEDPRIILPKEEFKSGVTEADQARYLALSYCWGSVEERLGHLTSDTTTISDRMKAIPWNTIPRTFQDIILLAIELGFHYVWIDSLCILQGERGDWEEESATMWSIFSNAFITVIAAAGSSAHTGFLSRSPSQSCKIFSPESTISYSLRHRPGTKWQRTDRMAEISGKRWITRGWTYQEERLARRVLMFGENKFFFDCRERERCEGTDVWLHRPSWSRIIYTHADTKRQGEGTAMRQWRKKIFDHWQWLCVQYSYRKLTIPEDKLPAFSGVAAAVASKIKSRYLAGLWEANLMHDIFWDTVGQAEESPTYLAPSWSWLSLNTQGISWKGPPSCLGESCKLHCRVLQAETTLAGPNRFGAITDAYLKLEGYIIGVKLVRNPGHYLENYPWSAFHQGQNLAKAKLDLLDSALDSTESVPNASALLISTCGNGQSATRGLLLEKTRRKDGLDVFRRVGSFTIYAESVFELEMKLSYWKELVSKVCILE